MSWTKVGQKAIFTGWTCVSGPEQFVQWLVDRSTEVSYRTFAANVDLSELHDEYRQLGIPLSKDWGITWLRSELLDGSTVWVMQRSGIEHLFAYFGQPYEATIAAIGHVTDKLEDLGWPDRWPWGAINAVLVNELGWTLGPYGRAQP